MKQPDTKVAFSLSLPKIFLKILKPSASISSARTYIRTVPSDDAAISFAWIQYGKIQYNEIVKEDIGDYFVKENSFLPLTFPTALLGYDVRDYATL